MSIFAFGISKNIIIIPTLFFVFISVILVTNNNNWNALLFQNYVTHNFVYHQIQ